MKKILAFLSAIIFVGSSTLAVSACGVSQGRLIPIEITGAPTKAENTENPLVDYVYNDHYVYNSDTVNYPLGVAAQLISDKLYNDPSDYNGLIWEEFYHSQEWQRGYFSSINYDVAQGFSFQDKNDKEFIISVNNNDLSEDNNIIRFYWFLTSSTPGSPPSKDTIIIPDLSEFTEEVKTVTRQGYVQLYLTIGTFRLDFSARINFDFFKIIDKNNQPAVLLSSDTFRKPFGDINFNDSDQTFNNVITNLEISKVA